MSIIGTPRLEHRLLGERNGHCLGQNICVSRCCNRGGDARIRQTARVKSGLMKEARLLAQNSRRRAGSQAKRQGRPGSIRVWSFWLAGQFGLLWSVLSPPGNYESWVSTISEPPNLENFPQPFDPTVSVNVTNVKLRRAGHIQHRPDRRWGESDTSNRQMG